MDIQLSLTNSMLGGACKLCMRKTYLQYKIMLQSKITGVPLRLGSASHDIFKRFYNGEDDTHLMHESAIKIYREGYEASIPFLTQDDIDRTEKEECLLGGIATAYPEVYADDRDNWEILLVEHPVELDILHPDTQEIHPFWKYSVTLDLVVRDKTTGVVHLVEHKTSGAVSSIYWHKLKLDPQLTGYMLALRALGYDIGDTIYNVIRKPGIRMKQTETKEDFYERLHGEFVNNRDKYFLRTTISRTAEQYHDFMLQLWGWANKMQEQWDKPEGEWLKSDINACVSWNRVCEMFLPCALGMEGPHMIQFVQRRTFHPEHEDRGE